MMLSSHIAFVISFVLSTSKLIPTRTIGDLAFFGAMLEMGMILLLIVNWKKFMEEKWNNNGRIILIFVGLFFSSLLVSLLWNIKDYETFSSVILIGISNVAVGMLLPISWIVFSTSFNMEHRWIGLGMLIFVHLIGIGQFLNIPGVSFVIQGTSGIMGVLPGAANSILSASTVYGSFSAITLVFSVTALTKAKLWWEENVEYKNFLKFLFILLVLFSAIGGILSLSRNFIIGILAGTGVIVIKGKHKKIFGAILMILILGVHLMAISNYTATAKLGNILPYIAKLHKNESIELRDFIPRFDDRSLSGRITVWKRAFNLWKEHPILGCGPGSFKTKSLHDRSVSVNNFYLQTLTEGGIIAFIIILPIIFKLWKLLMHTPYFPIFIAAVFMLMFDNFLDASAPWALTLSYTMSWPLKDRTVVRCATN